MRAAETSECWYNVALPNPRAVFYITLFILLQSRLNQQLGIRVAKI